MEIVFTKHSEAAKALEETEEEQIIIISVQSQINGAQEKQKNVTSFSTSFQFEEKCVIVRRDDWGYEDAEMRRGPTSVASDACSGCSCFCSRFPRFCRSLVGGFRCELF